MNKIEEKNYQKENYQRMDESHDKLIKWALHNIKIHDDFKFLDIGCGSGKMLRYFLEASKNSNAVGIDISDVSLKLSKENNKEFIDSKRLILEKSSIENFTKYDNYFDVVSAFCTLKFWKDLKQSFINIYKSLKDNGIFIIADHGQYDLQEVADLLEEIGFESILLIRRPINDCCFIVRKKDDTIVTIEN